MGEAERYCPSERRQPAEEAVCSPAWPTGQAPAPSLQRCPVQPQPACCPAVQQPELQPGLQAVPTAAAVCPSAAAAVCPSAAAAVCSPAATEACLRGSIPGFPAEEAAAAVCSSAAAVCPSAAAVCPSAAAVCSPAEAAVCPSAAVCSSA